MSCVTHQESQVPSPHILIMSDKTANIDGPLEVRFARAATRHRVSKESIEYVIANHRVHFEEPPPPQKPGSRSTRLVYLGQDANGRVLEIMAIQLPGGSLFVIHAMPLRAKYRAQYEEVEQ
jgi:hypothetical protein